MKDTLKCIGTLDLDHKTTLFFVLVGDAVKTGSKILMYEHTTSEHLPASSYPAYKGFFLWQE